MNIIRNERHISFRSSVGQYASLGGLLILLVGLVISFMRPTWTLPVLVSMPLGFALSVVGGFFADRFAGPLARHKTLAEVLKGLDYRHTLLQYVLPADHVLVEPGGCTCFVVKAQGGVVVYEQGKWAHRQRGRFFRLLVGQEALGKPDVEAQQEVERLRRYLEEQMDDADQVPLRGAIVFVNEDVKLEADKSPVPTFYRKKVKDWLRGPGDLKSLPSDLQQRLGAALGARQDEQD
ncbi:MAG: hypothetical protein PVG25_12495 [Anaerolineae bacterium]|jgi:hypothetical protein